MKRFWLCALVAVGCNRADRVVPIQGGPGAPALISVATRSALAPLKTLPREDRNWPLGTETARSWSTRGPSQPAKRD